MQWWGDHHYYFWVTRGVVESGSLNLPQEFTTLYPQAQRQLTWFGLHTVSAFIINTTGITFETALRYLAPILGPITLLLLWFLYSQFLPRGSALAAAYTTAMLDLVVFYQAEFHEQGMGIIAGVFFLAVMFSIYNAEEYSHKHLIIAFLALFSLSISHHMTALAIVILYFFFYLLSSAFDRYIGESKYRSHSQAFLILLIITNPIVYLWGAPNTVRSSLLGLISLLRLGALSNSGGVNVRRVAEGYQSTIITETVAMSSLLVKITLVLLATYSVSVGLRYRHEYTQRQLTIHTVAVGIAALLIFPIHRVAIVRMSIFGYVGLVGLAYLTFQRLSGRDLIGLTPRRVRVAGTVIFATLITITILSAYAPSLVDPSANIAPDSYTDIEPMGEQGTEVAEWLQPHSKKDVTHHWTGKLRGVLFYYGEIPLQQLQYTSNSSADGYAIYDTARTQSNKSVNCVYTNGRVNVTMSG